MRHLNSIPQDIVTELMGNVQFTKDGEEDCNIAEQIASNYYGSMANLLSTIRGEIRVPKFRTEFEKFVKEDFPTNTFYAPYFISHP